MKKYEVRMNLLFLYWVTANDAEQAEKKAWRQFLQESMPEFPEPEVEVIELAGDVTKTTPERGEEQKHTQQKTAGKGNCADCRIAYPKDELGSVYGRTLCADCARKYF